MRSSDTPASKHQDPKLLRGPQAPSDWSREKRSDDLLSPRTRELLEDELRKDDPEASDEVLVDEP